MNMRCWITGCLLLALCSSPGRATRSGEDVLVPYPHSGPQRATPSLPAIPRGATVSPSAAPEAGRLAPDGGVAANLGDEGHTVQYAFEAEEGTLSLFELECWGFSRGWSSSAGVRILDEEGTLHLEREASGGARYGAFIAFRAPRSASYRIELAARSSWYRFYLVRHTGFVGAKPNARWDLGQLERAHGYLEQGGASARYSLPVRAGERISIGLTQLRPFHENPANNQREALLRSALQESARIPDLDHEHSERRARAIDSDEIDLPLRPLYALRIAGSAEAGRSSAPRLEFTAAQDGRLDFDVLGHGRSEGGIFELRIERDAALHRVSGRVGDPEDEPLANVELAFLLEPSLAELGSATTDAEGEYALELPAGDYSVVLAGGTRASIERVRTRVADAALELNLVRSL